ncbi:MAG TPA: Gfo/Idh/MocA family oxidoreductase [Planctomycetota bacterium]
MDVSRPAPRVAVVGARRLREGTGPFLARQCVAAGARLVAVVGTSTASARAAAEDCAAFAGAAPHACTSVAEAAGHGLDAVVIASPAGTHGAHVEAALAHGLHVLCEKPLLAADSDPPAMLRAHGDRVAQLAARFAAAGLTLSENCQWPHTLAAFRALHPDFDPGAATRFRMELAPGSAHAGMRRWSETASHPMSLLQAAAGDACNDADGILAVDFVTAPSSGAAICRFQYRSGGAPQRPPVAAELHLLATDTRPRPAAFAFDGRPCRRRVAMPGYRIHFESDAGPAVAAEDPMEAGVRAFLTRVVRKEGGADRGLVARQRMLGDLLLAAAGSGAGA